MKVVVNPRWQDEFKKEVALGEKVVAIHDIGSTAIPNIYAKPVIDILVEVKDIDAVDEPSDAMKKASGLNVTTAV